MKYRHANGHLYEKVCEAFMRHDATLTAYVVYKAEDGSCWIRTRVEFETLFFPIADEASDATLPQKAG